MALCSTDSHWSVSLKVLLRGEYYLAYNIKNVKMPSYHSIYENACKLQKIYFWLGFVGLNI